jgi:putative flippase GtrA
MTEVIEHGGKPGSALAAQALRFLVAGAINTALSIAVYQAALFVTGHVVAYGIAYAAGVVFAYVAYARHVFDAPLSTGRFVVFALFYAVSGVIGTLVNAGLIEHLALHPRLAIFVTAMIMLLLNYVGSKWCLRGSLRREP